MNLDSFSLSFHISQSPHPAYFPHKYFLNVSALCLPNYHCPLTNLCWDYCSNLLNGIPVSSLDHWFTCPSFHNFDHCVPLPKLPFVFFSLDLLLLIFQILVWPYHQEGWIYLLSPPTVLWSRCPQWTSTLFYVGSLTCLSLLLDRAQWGHNVLFMFVDLALSMSLGT